MVRLAFIALVASGVAAIAACDITIESPGGSKAGASYKFTVSSTATPVTVKVSIGGDSLQTTTTAEKQESVTVNIPESARGKTLEIVAENKDGCLVSWTETVQ
jgi:flavin reductase (DIM6/NTAB) family NADH-FMN oxidoreductase RutF